MISLNKNDKEPNKSSENLQKLLNIIYNEPKYYPGSYHENTDFVELINIANSLLFVEGNNSISLIIDKKSNNSINITIDTLK